MYPHLASQYNAWPTAARVAACGYISVYAPAKGVTVSTLTFKCRHSGEIVDTGCNDNFWCSQ